MRPEARRRIVGFATGIVLAAAGVFELSVAKSDFETPAAQRFCQAGLCAAQFSPERVFEIAQKATLGDPRGQLNDFKRAVQLSPASAYRWADLSEAEFNVRDFTSAEYAISQALQAGPRSPVILTRAANLYFEIGDTNMVLQQLRKVLSDPGLWEYFDNAFLIYSRLGLPLDEILQRGVPPNKPVVSSLLTFWSRLNKPEEAAATWKWASARGLVDGASTGIFFHYYLNAGHNDDAQQLWQNYVRTREPGYRSTNWIFNPGFETPPVPSPFDWNIEPRQNVEAAIVQDAHSAGRSAFRIRFNGEANIAYHQTFQEMVLPPGKYQFSVMVKTDQVTTDEGVRLHFFDPPLQAKVNVWLDTVTGTQDWKRLSKTFEVPPGVKLVRLEIARNSSQMFDNKIGGTTWVDGLQLSRVP
jgi:tetratricopeptide (TPR) repeat protein